jgi:hypothetical protein
VTGTERLHVVVLLGHNVVTWSLATSWSFHVMIHGTRAWAALASPWKERVVPLAVLLDRLALKALPDLAARRRRRCARLLAYMPKNRLSRN